MVNLSLKQRIPHLENGDRLTRYEFERRYQAMPRHQKAELIEGVVYLASHYALRVMLNHIVIQSLGWEFMKHQLLV